MFHRPLNGQDFGSQSLLLLPAFFGLVTLFHFDQCCTADVATSPAQLVFDGLKASAEFTIGFSQCFFRFDLPAPGNVRRLCVLPQCR